MDRVFEQGTILKGLERKISDTTNSEEADRILGTVAEYLIENIDNVERIDFDTFYENLDEYVDSYSRNKISIDMIEVGKEVYYTLKETQKSYNLGISPDKRKLRKLRNEEIKTLNREMREYGRE